MEQREPIESRELDIENWIREFAHLIDRTHDFEHFKPLPGAGDVKRAFMDLAYGKDDRPFLLCYGGVGNGKTHLCEASVIVFNQRVLWCSYSTCADVINHLRTGINAQPGERNLQDLLETYSQRTVLILDDMGVEAGTPWEISQLEIIIDRRLRGKKITIVTTNKDLKQISERIVSRFSDPAVSQLVLNQGSDYRRRTDIEP